MSLADKTTGELWKKFVPRRKEISNKLTSDLISMNVYPSSYFPDFKLTDKFEKWATVEVSNFDNVPLGMETFILPDGQYAVFNYNGLSTDNSIFQYILATWLPSSDFKLDDRPHFEILGANYKNNDPTSEEEIWMPIKPKT